MRTIGLDRSQVSYDSDERLSHRDIPKTLKDSRVLRRAKH